jgi:hypothetical protein
LANAPPAEKRNGDTEENQDEREVPMHRAIRPFLGDRGKRERPKLTQVGSR